MTGRLEHLFFGDFGPELVEEAISTARTNPGVLVNKVSEHEFAMLILLCELGADIFREPDDRPDLTSLCERFASDSILYIGRILPRAIEAIGLLRDAVAEQSVETVIEVCDHASQGWPDYAETVFPTAFWQLARTMSSETRLTELQDTSYVLWLRGLAAAKEGDGTPAREFLERSLERYRAYDYYADTAWLYTDLVLTDIMLGLPDRATTAAEEQRSYVETVLRERTASAAQTGRLAFHLGDVHSGRYQTFVEQAVLRDPVLRDEDAGLLWRYVGVSESLLSAVRWQSRSHLESALDRFSNGWRTFLDSSYPDIFARVGRAALGERNDANVYLPVDAMWRHLLLMYRRKVEPATLSSAFQTVQERLRNAGLSDELDVLRLDTTLLTWALHGRDSAAEWCAPHVHGLRKRAPTLVSALIDALNSTDMDAPVTAAMTYLAERAKYPVPDFASMLELLSAWQFQRDAVNRVEISLHGNELFVDGFRVYSHCPPALRAILSALASELDRGRARGEEPAFLRAGELAQSTGRSTASLVQAIRRFRMACTDVMGDAIGQEDVLQGRPGYRLNPATVSSVMWYPGTQ
ncbi:hypothetical protein [Nocardiopsis rhodophaea]|uniref:hypothetical protein n=1 Tax=Nocardiopsis rhodophaea TaxID=280238 RepID=UPI0031E3FAF4